MAQQPTRESGAGGSAAHAEAMPRSADVHMSVLQMLSVAASLALITAFGELVLLAILKFVLGRQLNLGPDVVWR